MVFEKNLGDFWRFLVWIFLQGKVLTREFNIADKVLPPKKVAALVLVFNFSYEVQLRKIN